MVKNNTPLLKICLLLVINVATTSIYAQTYEWAKAFGGASEDRSNSIAVDASGNVYTTGYFGGTADFNPGAATDTLTSAGNTEIFVQKMDASGNFLWAKAFGGTAGDWGSSIAVDPSGNVYTTGVFQGTADFDPGSGTDIHTSAGNWEIFVQKMDASGNFLWAKTFGGTILDYGFSVAVDASGNVYTTGFFYDTVDFDPGVGTANLISGGYGDIFVQKMDASGNFLWAKAFGGTHDNTGYSITVDASGNVYTTGIFNGTVDFDPGVGTANLTAAGNWDNFVQKMDASGNFLWAKAFGGTSSDVSNSITVDASGNVYTTGSFKGTADFDPGVGTANLTSVGNDDVFVQKMDSSGNFLWAKSFGSTARDRGKSIALDASGNVYTTGNFTGTVDFNPGAGTDNLTSVANSDVFVQKMDASGNFMWAKGFGVASGDERISIAVDGSDNVYTTGCFWGTRDFDPGAGTDNLSIVGIQDIFVQKMSQCAIIGTDTRMECNSYTWIDGNTYTESNDTATYNIVGGASNGCDSLVSLDLTITNVSDITTSTSGTTITANNSGATYQWLDCGNNNAVIADETGQSFTTTASGNYAVELSENGCVDTSACVTITTVGILESSFGNGLSVYPNPTKGNLVIDLGEVYENAEVSITDVLGKRVDFKTMTQSQTLHLFVEPPAGVYIVYITSGEKRAVIQLLKE